MTINIALSKFRDAYSVLKDRVSDTPLLRFPDLSNERPIFLKAESLQPSGSFKIRGATYCMSQMPKSITKVIAFSTGNHAQAVAMAAKKLGLQATIVMSPDARESKVQATRQLGAEVLIVPVEERAACAEKLAAQPNCYYIPPYNHLDIIAGQGTIGLEILNDIEPAAVFVPVGGGGLIAGIAAAIKQMNPSVKMIGVEPENENDACRSFKSGKLVGVQPGSHSIADAVRVPMLGEIPFVLMQKYVDDMITVTEEQILDATLQIANKMHIIAEPAGALSLAGALQYQEKLLSDQPIVCILSGGNILLHDLCLLG